MISVERIHMEIQNGTQGQEDFLIHYASSERK